MRRFVPKNMNLIPENAHCAFEGEIFDVYQWPQELFDGSTATFEMLKRPDTVSVIAIKDGKLVLTKQKQPRTSEYCTVPGGRVDKEDADELAAAKRELQEETGMLFKNWRLVRAVQPHRKIDWVVYTFLATHFEGQTETKLDGGEQIETILVDFAELPALAESGIDCSPLAKDLDGFETLDDILSASSLFEYE